MQRQTDPQLLVTEIRELGGEIRIAGERLQVQLPKGVLNQSLRQRLASQKDALLDELRRGKLVRRTTTTAPVTPLQHRLLRMNELDVDGVPSTHTVTWRIFGALDTDRLKRALNGLLARHEILRTHFVEKAGNYEQVPLERAQLELPVSDLRDFDEQDAHAKARELVESQSKHRFCHQDELPLIVQLLRLSSSEHMLALSFSHVVFDASSEAPLEKDLMSGYASDSQAQLSPRAIQFGDYAAWTSASDPERDLGWWTENLGSGTKFVHWKDARPEAHSLRGPVHIAEYSFSSDLGSQLHSLARDTRATPYVVLFAVFAAALHGLTGLDRVIIHTSVANREHVELEGLIGQFGSILPMSIDLRENPTFLQLLARVRGGVLEALAHRHVSLEQVVEAAQEHGTRVPGQFFFVTYNESRPFSVNGIRFERGPSPSPHSNYDLAVLANIDAQNRVHLLSHTREDRVPVSTRSEIEKLLTQVLSLVAKAPETRLSELAPASLDPISSSAPRMPTTEPSDALTCRLVDLLKQILSCDDIEPTDNFFALGGDSILAMSLLARLETEFGVHLPFSTFLRNASPARLAAALTSN